MDMILNFIVDFIQGISVQTWVIIIIGLFFLYHLAKIVGTILRPIFQIVSMAFMLFSMYKLSLMLGLF